MRKKHYTYFFNALIEYVNRYEDKKENKKILINALNMVNEEIFLKYFSEVLYIIRHDFCSDNHANYECLYNFILNHKDKLLIEDALATAAFLNKNINIFYKYYISKRYYENVKYEDDCVEKNKKYIKA